MFLQSDKICDPILKKVELLGSGVRLFGQLDIELKLKLMETRNYNGITEVVYEKR